MSFLIYLLFCGLTLGKLIITVNILNGVSPESTPSVAYDTLVTLYNPTYKINNIQVLNISSSGTPSPGPDTSPSPGPGTSPSPGPGTSPSPGPGTSPSPGTSTGLVERTITYYASYQGTSSCFAGLKSAVAKQYLFRPSQNYTIDHEVWELDSFYYTYAPPSTYTFYASAPYPGHPNKNLVCTTYSEGVSCNAGSLAGFAGSCVYSASFTFQADIPLVIGQSDTVGNFSLRVTYDTAGCPLAPCQAVDPIVYLREAVFNDGGGYSCWPYKSFLYIDSSSKITYWAIVEYGGRSLNMTCSSSGGNCVLSPAFKFSSDYCTWTITLSIISSTVLPFGIPTPSLPVPVNPVPGPGMVSNSLNGTELTQTKDDKSIYYIVGGVIGGIVVLVIVSSLAGYWYSRNSKKEVSLDPTLATIKDHKPS